MMKKMLFVVALFFAITTLDAQIVYTNLESNPEMIDSEYELNIDGQSSAEFMIQNYSAYGEAVYFASFENGAAVVSTAADYNANVDMLSENAEIGASSTFYGCQGGSPYFNVLYLPGEYVVWASGTVAYVGLKFVRQSTGTTHYGWAKVKLGTNASYVYLYGYAYNSTPNAPIRAGQTNDSGLNEVVQNSFSFYPNPAKGILNIEGQNIRSISIYNTLGQEETKFSYSENQIDISNLRKGIYILNILSNEGMIREKFIKE